MSQSGRARQDEVYRGGIAGRRPVVPTAFPALERRARRAMTRRAWAYVAGGAGSEETVRANRAAFDRHRIVPRVLRGVGERDTSVELFGRRLDAPVLLAPIGALDLVSRQADLAVAHGAGEAGVPMIVSNQAGHAMEDIAPYATAGWWFQLYWSTSDDLVDSFLARAEAAGAGAVVVTLDTTVLGWRPRDLDLGHLPFARGLGIAQYTSDPVFARLTRETAEGPARPAPRPTPTAVRTLLEISRHHPGRFVDNLRSPLPRAAVETFLRVYSRPTLSWDDIATLRSRTRLPVVLKGVLHPDDARRALDAGVDGVLVSNHGGRQVDGSVATLDLLPGVVDAVGDRVPVLLDSGVRSGADVARALALGATAVCLGRPFAYGLALAGAAGVAQVTRDVLAELDLTLALAGARSPGDLELASFGAAEPAARTAR
ncbi:alpha-hydroxy-acid oxidizing protein [Actinomycetospora cinnamomea]|uniref:Isopentenyl diphosphate isomerase/L-lactate dehydrogenase-like FMN-dependent dehydrogenase n=1 Tax=Actinomycetospora cinnamomea TaxID=663609 RepID=A0A2U1FIN3_9PSEU|nr:alpha-hydroxy-acid oxidizing protein [Actinomycetospora cinnamomea]PVZ12011.1 isopentenyl diphosphate isomerase/L-lactate dehydrogenase-like FMN-dependent dehydrogenase [Actinomycetospora cinnamomea]